MGRYFSSFLITAIFYLLLLSSLLYSFNDISTINQQTKSSEQKVKVTLLAQSQSKPPIEKKVLKQEKPKVEKKIVKKETSKKKIVKKPKKEIVKKIKPETIIKEEKLVKNTPIENTNTIQKTQIKQNKTIVKKPTPIIDTHTIQIKQNQYFATIKKRIDQNKSYPRMAVKRAIEGDVKIKFTISKHGELLSFQIVDGKRIFKKSIIKAIEKTFPLAPPKDIFTSNLDLSLTLQYKLY